MGIYHAIAEKVCELGRASPADLEPHFPELTKKQIKGAVSVALKAKCIKQLKKARGLGGGKGSTPGIYGPPDVDPDDFPRMLPPDADPTWVRPVSSVWELAERV
jgi:hypothetical protein